MCKHDCGESLRDKGIETRVLRAYKGIETCRKQKGRRKACGAEARGGRTVWAVKVLPTIVGVLG